MVTTGIIQSDADDKACFSESDQELIRQKKHFTGANKQIAKQAVSHSLSDIHKPIGVSQYQLTQSLPENLKSSLPSIEEIEAGLSGDDHE